MILDIDSLADETLLYCDICLVGAGAVGMAIGRELAASNLKTVILESGSLHEHAATQALYDSQIVGLPFIGATQGRFRVLGGTTTRWGGQSLPLD